MQLPLCAYSFVKLHNLHLCLFIKKLKNPETNYIVQPKLQRQKNKKQHMQ